MEANWRRIIGETLREGKQPVWVAFCNAWRRLYPELTPSDHSACYAVIADAFPEQNQVDLASVVAFLSQLRPGPLRICEVGGWRGDLAKIILGIAGDRISAWVNHEITSALVSLQKCSDPRYRLALSERFLWEDGIEDADALIAANVIEHLSEEHLTAFIGAIPPTIKAAFIQCPLAEDGRTEWADTVTLHALYLGWPAVEALFAERGFTVRYRGGNVRWFRRE